MKKAVIFTYIPSPYRTVVFDELEKMDSTALQVVYMSKGDSKFDWRNQSFFHQPIFMDDQMARKGKLSLIQAVWRLLNIENPQAVITCGFTLPMLVAMLWAVINRRKRLVNTDAWINIEKHYSWKHRWIRRIIYPRVHAAIPVSEKGKLMFKQYGVAEEKIFISHYAIDHDHYIATSVQEKDFDLIFSGQMIERKMPQFFAQVVKNLKKRRPDLKVLILGNGELKDSLLSKLKEIDVYWEYPGFVQPDQLPRFYSRAKVLLFPTLSDSWGVVANDAMSSGTLVMTCENAGCAHEIVEHGVNGWVLPLEADLWVSQLETVLSDDQLYKQFREHALMQAEKYHPKKSAKMLLAAISFVLLPE